MGYIEQQLDLKTAALRALEDEVAQFKVRKI